MKESCSQDLYHVRVPPVEWSSRKRNHSFLSNNEPLWKNTFRVNGSSYSAAKGTRGSVSPRRGRKLMYENAAKKKKEEENKKERGYKKQPS